MEQFDREWAAKGFMRPANGYDTSPDSAFRTPRGTHYDTGGVTPVDLIRDQKLNFFEGNVIKYVTRHRKKNGKEDLLKAQDYLRMLIESEYPE